MSAEKEQPEPRPQGAEEKIGRVLGKAFGRLRKTRIWRDTERAYREGLEGGPGKSEKPEK